MIEKAPDTLGSVSLRETAFPGRSQRNTPGRVHLMQPDAHHPYHSLPWLERFAVHVAGYQDSLRSGDRRAADRALRQAVIHRLQAIHARLEEAVRQCQAREATRHIPTLERVIGHVDRVLARLHASDTQIETSYEEQEVGSQRASFLHAAHLALFEQAEVMVQHFDAPDIDHDRLPHLEADLVELERLLDEKAEIYLKLD
jgi:hypothetical protein